MRLLATGTSPFARKVLLLAHETGLTERIAIVATEVASDALGRENPLNKVPALILDDGSSLFDSPVICEYLDSLHGGMPLFPPPGPARWQALREQALADGICDAAVLRMIELRQQPAAQRQDWLARQKKKIDQGLAEFDKTHGGRPPLSPSATPTIGDLALLATLGYLDFRFPNDNWRARHVRLDAWFVAASDRPGFRATKPVG